MVRSLKPLSEKVEEVDERAGKLEEGVIGQLAVCDFVGFFADQFFELSGVVEGDGEELADEEEVEELLLDFGVHEDFIGHAGHQRRQVDTLAEPLPTHHAVDLRQRYHILTLETFTSPHARLVLLPQPAFAEVLDHRYEDVLGVIFLKSEMAIAGIAPRGVLLFRGGPAAARGACHEALPLFFFNSYLHVAPRIKN